LCGIILKLERILGRECPRLPPWLKLLENWEPPPQNFVIAYNIKWVYYMGPIFLIFPEIKGVVIPN
jgi:hypothetical protein